MKILEIGICDNEQIHADYLHELVRKYFVKKEICYQIRTSINSEGLLKYASVYDIVFLDVEMNQNDINGIEIGKAIRAVNKRALIIYVTGYRDYIFAAQDNHSYQFLIKPFKKEKLYSTLEEAVEYLSTPKPELSLLLMNGKYLSLESENIYYFEFKDKAVLAKTAIGEYELNMTKEQVLNFSKEFTFACPHQRYFVNLVTIFSLRQDCIVMTNNDILPVASRRSKEFRECFTRWAFKKRKDFLMNFNSE